MPATQWVAIWLVGDLVCRSLTDTGLESIDLFLPSSKGSAFVDQLIHS